MPQMSPLNWLMLNLFFMLMYLMMMSSLYFTIYYLPSKNKINKKLLEYKWKWMW